MTELLTRPARSAADATPTTSVWWRGVLAALWAVSVGVAALLVVVLVAWAADSRAGAGSGAAMRSALQIWLVSHRVPLHVEGGSIAVAPLLLTLALAFLVARAAAVLARGQGVEDPAGVATVAVAVAIPYAVLTTFVAAGANSGDVRPSPVAALLAGLLLGLVAGGWGAARGAGRVRECWELIPDAARGPLGAGLAATGVLLAGSGLLLAVAGTIHVGDAIGTVNALGGGAVAAIAVIALDVALLPNAAVATMGYLAGPGFAVGAGTSVTLGGAHLGSLPALPLMAAVPHGPAPALVTAFGIAVFVGAGALAAWLVSRSAQHLSGALTAAAGAGAVAGVLTAVLAALAGGPGGPGRMAAIGTSPWQAGLAVAAEIAVVACAATAAMVWRRGR